MDRPGRERRACRLGARSVRRARAVLSGSHLLNFQSEAGDDVVRAAFGDNYARLADVKRKYDPTNFFSLNQNIRPA